MSKGTFWSSNYLQIQPTSGLTWADGRIYTKYAGSPEGNVTATVGSTCDDTTNGIKYFKNSGSGNTGWLALLTSATAAPLGTITGGLIFNSTSLPPTVLAGTYDIGGTLVNKTSNTTLAVTDVFDQSNPAIDTYCQYQVYMNSSGTCKYSLYGEGLITGATGGITSITSSGTTYTLTISSGTYATGPTNLILEIYGNDNINGRWKITGGNGSTTYTFTTTAGFTNGGASGTYNVYNRVKPLHGTGTATGITTDANIQIYNPSCAINGWPASTADFSATKNGIYMTATSLTGWRALGDFRKDGTNVRTDVNSYGAGSNKNDNFFWVDNAASLVTNAIRWTNVNRMHGCDYVYVDDGSVGSEWTFKTRVFGSCIGYGVLAAGVTTTGILLGTSTNTSNTASASQFFNLPSSTNPGGSSLSFCASVNDVLKPLSDTDLSTGKTKFIGFIRRAI